MIYCPWDNFKQATITFCENNLCGWIVQPANTWSNIGYLIVGLLVLRAARRDNRGDLNAIGYSALLVCVGSTLFHATATLWAEFLDLAGMYLFAGVMLAANARRYWRLNLSFKTLYWVIAGVCLALMGLWPSANIPIFIVVIVLAVLLEWLIYREGRHFDEAYRPLLWLAGFFAVAFTAWALDITGVWCDPDNHWFNGHALWHLSNSFCFWFAYKFYKGVMSA